jgi:hypothetical protein
MAIAQHLPMPGLRNLGGPPWMLLGVLSAPWIEGPVVTAVPASPMPDATLDLKELFLNVAKTGAISPEWYLIGIEVGWEIHQGQGPMFTDFFEIGLNDEDARL